MKDPVFILDFTHACTHTCSHNFLDQSTEFHDIEHGVFAAVQSVSTWEQYAWSPGGWLVPCGWAGRARCPGPWNLALLAVLVALTRARLPKGCLHPEGLR